MARTTKTRRRRDDTWVVKEDEFHPNMKVAATESDKLARLAARRNAQEEIARAQRRAENAPDRTSKLNALNSLATWKDELRRIETEIEDETKEDDGE